MVSAPRGRSVTTPEWRSPSLPFTRMIGGSGARPDGPAGACGGNGAIRGSF